MACRASAISTAIASLFTRNVRPSPSNPIGGTTGITPSFSRSWRSFVSTRSTFPVCRKSTPPRMPAGCAMTAFAYAARRSTLVRPCMISFISVVAASSETWSVASSVMPVPSLFVGFTPRAVASFSIWNAAPCTRITFTLSERSTARSSRMFPKFGDAAISPSTAITKIFSRKRGT